MKRFLFELSDELLAAIDAAKGDSARNPFIERLLSKTAAIKKGAKIAGVVLQSRLPEGRGHWRKRKQKQKLDGK
jgi:hypothetical protein